mgnify:FL=1
MATTLAAQEVGSTVTLKVNGADAEFLVVHQGNPDPDVYDPSCEGTWLLMKNVYSQRPWGSASCYADAPVHTWLNSTFLELLDSGIRPAVKTVRLPYAEGSDVHTGAEGVRAQIFLLSMREMGTPAAQKTGLADEGALLDYFTDGDGGADPLRASSARYWTRSPYTGGGGNVWSVAGESGICSYRAGSSSYGVRPALILPQAMPVKDGAVQPNSAPVLTSSSGVSGADLGTRNSPFSFEYMATDPEGASLSLTEKLDQAVTRTLTAASGSTQRFEAVYDALAFLKLANGAHTLQVTASDGMASAAFQATFTKAVRAASLTLTQPIAAGKPITAATLQVEGSIPDDAAFSVQVTNNALDDQPVWQDATEAVRQGGNVLFTHSTAAKGPAFNFRIEAARGASGDGGYISKVSGAFQ